jgi:glycosyltransferase involved in cell wall biosynthesis
MIKPKSPRVSVIIPCFNEEAVLANCLEALRAQTSVPLEVIVVDNNSSDKTALIAKKFGVKVVQEKQQGLIPARNKGFSVAKGDILAKLDADSLPSADWIKTIQQIFLKKQAQAITGTGIFYDAPAKWLVRLQRNLFAVWLNRIVMGHHMLWGSNLAIRSSAWRQINSHCCDMPNIMEDLDIAAHIVEEFGAKAVRYEPKMRVDISARRSMVSLKRNWLYLKMWPKTLSLHGYERRLLLWPAIGFLLFWMGLGSKINRFYNQEQDKMIFNLSQWRNNSLYTRNNP